MLKLVHHRGLHWRHVGQAKKLPGFHRRAIDFDIYLHVSSCSILTPQYRRDRRNQARFLCKTVPPGAVNPQICSTKALGRERGRVGERRLAGHHLRQQAACHRAKRQAVVLMAEIEPQPGMTRLIGASTKPWSASSTGWLSTALPWGARCR